VKGVRIKLPKSEADHPFSSEAIDPKDLCTVFVSPRSRTQKTFDMLFENITPSDLPSCILSEEVREWDYGEYEGLRTKEVRERQPDWDIWRDGCVGGESANEMRARADKVIAVVRQHHKEYVEGSNNTRDVLIIAHGQINGALVVRWLNSDLGLGTHFNMKPGGVTTLSYNHNSLNEPALDGFNLYADLN